MGFVVHDVFPPVSHACRRTIRDLLKNATSMPVTACVCLHRRSERCVKFAKLLVKESCQAAGHADIGVFQLVDAGNVKVVEYRRADAVNGIVR
jgi:hypothetical protein